MRDSDGGFTTYEITPEQFGYTRCAKAELTGGTPEENAEITRSILNGEGKGAKRQAVCLNAGAALYIAGKADSLEAGMRKAEHPGFLENLLKPGMSYICEVKKASPSKGVIAEEFLYLQIAREYEAAGARAISCGVTTDKIFAMVEEIRKTCRIPLVFMTYANVVFSYGTERFMKKAAEVGMDGLILPDVPFEEKEEFDAAAKAEGLDLISLIAPTSHERITKIAREAEGFVYCVSSLGVTGTRSQITTDIAAMVRLVKEVKNIPCAVGFGISTPEQAKKWHRSRMEPLWDPLL